MLSMAFSMMTNRQKQKVQGKRRSLDMAYGVAAWGASASTFFSSAQRRHGAPRHSHKNPHHGRIEPASGHFKNFEEQRGLVLVTGTTVPVSPPRSPR